MARFSVIPAAAVIDSRLSLRELSVLCAIGIHTDRNGWCYPSSERLGEMLGVSGGMVRQSVAVLAKCGYVQIVGRRREDGGQSSNAIRVMMDAEQPSEAMRFSLDPSEIVHPPVSSGLTPPVSLELTPPVSSGLTRKPPSKAPSESRKERGATAPILPDWLPVDSWEDWHRFRNARQGWTAHARTLSLRKLESLYNEGQDPRSVIEQSIERGWTGLFPIRQDFQRQDRPSKQMQGLKSILGVNIEDRNAPKLVRGRDSLGASAGVRPEFAGLPFFGDYQGDD